MFRHGKRRKKEFIAVTQRLAPGFVYSTAASPKLGHEFLLAGRVDLAPEEAYRLLLQAMGDYATGRGSGRFDFSPISPSWASKLLFGVPAEYRDGALQVTEVSNHLLTETVCESEFPNSQNSAWWFLDEEAWVYPIPVSSTLGVTLEVLKGATVTDYYRWELDYWEMTEVPCEEVDTKTAYVIPWACLLDLGFSLEEAVLMPVLPS